MYFIGGYAADWVIPVNKWFLAYHPGFNPEEAPLL